MSEALVQSLELTAIGMAVIFLFMSFLIVLLHYLVAFAIRFMPDREGTDENADATVGTGAVAGAGAGSAGNPLNGPTGTTHHESVIAAIAAALHHTGKKG